MEHIAAFYQPQKNSFTQHLNVDGNARIIFSGSYGIGKTYFLNYLFENEKPVTDRYIALTLSPVNYSVSSNEDIFDYIKYDIFFELVLKGAVVDGFDLALSHQLILHLKNNWSKIAGRILGVIPAIGKSIDPKFGLVEPLVKFLIEEKKYLDEHYNNLKGEIDEPSIIDNFISLVENRNGSLYDQGIVTSIIEKKIQDLKINKDGTKKEVVLIIDDVDRIDPGHIFRILNVFAAHFDKRPSQGGNRFKIDKVLLVCDVENIRKMFHYKYGADVDFNGYIDKFYSTEIFHFDPVNDIMNNLLDVLSQYKLESPSATKELARRMDQFFHVFILALLNKNLINLRSLIKYCDVEQFFHPTKIRLSNGSTLTPYEYPLLWQLILIKQIIGDKVSFLNCMIKIEVIDLFVRIDVSIDKFFKELLLLATSQIHFFEKNVQAASYTIPTTETQFTFDTKSVGPRRIYIDKIDWEPPAPRQEEEWYRENLLYVYRNALDNLLSNKIIV